MTPDNDKASDQGDAAFNDFAKRLDEARADRDGADAAAAQKARGQAMGLGIKLASELIAALLVGGALGYGVDLLTGRTPLFLLIGLALGMAAAFMNVLRLMKKMSAESAPPQAPSSARAPTHETED
ncbi:MAG: AtpZ/AtpI family protein [Pseudomonadota bacterium]